MAIWNMRQMNCKDMQNIRFNVHCAVILFALAWNCFTLMVLHLVAGTVFLNIMQKKQVESIAVFPMKMHIVVLPNF